MKKNTVWIFCTVIDNFGDIGVSWRLAREWERRFGGQVILWLDDLTALQTIEPDAPKILPHSFQNISLKKWQEGVWADLDDVPDPDLVIEMFACRLPENVILRIKNHASLWLNWEYLSAEDWAIRTHTMRSVQANGAAKYFWQMGFQENSGGLLRETNFRLPETPYCPQNHDLKVFLFGYESPVWADFFAAWRDLSLPIHAHLAGEQIINSLKKNGFLPQNALTKFSETYRSGSLNLTRQAFVPQSQFDDLLQHFDWLFVRGEDSFVRAQFSGKPLFWHIYPQDEWAHLDKLDAFWRQVYPHFSDEIHTAHFALSQALNGANILTKQEYLSHWHTLFLARQTWAKSAQNWQDFLLNQNDTLTKLAIWLNHQPQT